MEARDFDDELDNDSGWDSGIEDDRVSLWTSLNSEAYNFRFENGRRYHAYREGRKCFIGGGMRRGNNHVLTLRLKGYFHPNDEVCGVSYC